MSLRHLMGAVLIWIFMMQPARAQDVKIIKIDELVSMMQKQNDTTYLFNFWATWCKPCIKEMPHFEQIQEQYKSSKLKVMLISLDFDTNLDSKLIPYLKKHNIRSSVYLLNETDANTWIDLVSPTWEGTIPATLVINKKKQHRSFYEHSLDLKELEKIIKPLI